jgi:fluoride exporter
MRDLLLIFFGGGLGSVIRFMMGRWINSQHSSSFPFGTLVVNITACAVLGCTIGLADQKQLISPAARIFWTIGFCGGYSTFSTFSAETLVLIQNGLTLSAVLYILLSLLLCLAATFAGLYAGAHV